MGRAQILQAMDEIRADLQAIEARLEEISVKLAGGLPSELSLDRLKTTGGLVS